MFSAFLMCGALLAPSRTVLAGFADVMDVKIVKTGADLYRITVTVTHEDEGWDHYADRWDVLDEDGNLLGSRVLMHPHVEEQPFTRSLLLALPMGVKRVVIRAHDKIHGLGGLEKSVDVPH